MKHSFISLFFIFGILFVLINDAYAGREEKSFEPRENVYVVTDRDLYIAGERMFFNLSVLNNNQQSHFQSQYAYLALRSHDNIVKKITLRLDDRRASGSLYLPDTLSTGMYELVAFTNWLRNRGEQAYFRKTVFIANRFDTGLKAVEPTPADDKDLTIDFFPEGGQFIAGNNHRILIKSSGSFDTSLRDFLIRDENLDTITQGVLNHHGFTVVELTPEDGSRYSLLLDGSTRSFELPEVQAEGLSLKVSEHDGGLLIELWKPDPGKEEVVVSLSQQQALIREMILHIDSGLTEINIPSSAVRDGVLLVGASSVKNRNTTQRYLYLNRNSLPEVRVTGPETLGRREKARFDLALAGTSSKHANVSVSLARPNSVTAHRADISQYLRSLQLADQLGLDFLTIHKEFGALTDQEVNALLIAKQDDYAGNTLNEKHPDNGYHMEIKGVIVSGRVIYERSSAAVQNARVVLNAPDTLINLQYTYTDNYGGFYFLLSDYYRSKELFFSVDPSTVAGPCRILIDDKFGFALDFDKRAGRSIWNKKEFINKSQDIVGIMKQFGVDYSTEPGIGFYRTGRPPIVYYRPGSVIRTEDYFPLDDIREIARELVPVWRVRQTGDRYFSTLLCGNSGQLLPGEPVYFIDGIILYNLNHIQHLGSAQIDKIEIQNRQWVHGDMKFPGIIGIFTRTGEYKNITGINGSPARVFHESYRHHKIFDPPSYAEHQTADHTKPDLRQVLYWTPDMTISTQNTQAVELYTGDLTGVFLLNIEGMTEDGRPVSFSKEITVN
ncbi:MAG: hypothetical protein RG741_04010 [Bacteroidales bacterium]|nr:hypothetical protein [Bacteroidales bacterium]